MFNDADHLTRARVPHEQPRARPSDDWAYDPKPQPRRSKEPHPPVPSVAGFVGHRTSINSRNPLGLVPAEAKEDMESATRRAPGSLSQTGVLLGGQSYADGCSGALFKLASPAPSLHQDHGGRCRRRIFGGTSRDTLGAGQV